MIYLLGFIGGYLSVFVIFAAYEVLRVNISRMFNPAIAKRAFIDAFLEIFCHPYIKFSLADGFELCAGIKTYYAGYNPADCAYDKFKYNHIELLSLKFWGVKGK